MNVPLIDIPWFDPWFDSCKKLKLNFGLGLSYVLEVILTFFLQDESCAFNWMRTHRPQRKIICRQKNNYIKESQVGRKFGVYLLY